MLNYVRYNTDIPINKISPKDIYTIYKYQLNIKLIGFYSAYSEIDYHDTLVGNSTIVLDACNKVDPAFSESIDGFSLLTHNQYFLFLNILNYPERQQFTLLHELAHITQHFKNKKYQAYALFNAQHLFENDLGLYPEELQPYENQANIIASFLSISSSNLINLIIEGKTFTQIKIKYGMSMSALHNRIRNLLLYEIEVNDYNYILHLILNYKYNNGNELSNFLKMWRASYGIA